MVAHTCRHGNTRVEGGREAGVQGLLRGSELEFKASLMHTSPRLLPKEKDKTTTKSLHLVSVSIKVNLTNHGR